jgi:hypothetical protein
MKRVLIALVCVALSGCYPDNQHNIAAPEYHRLDAFNIGCIYNVKYYISAGNQNSYGKMAVMFNDDGEIDTCDMHDHYDEYRQQQMFNHVGSTLHLSAFASDSFSTACLSGFQYYTFSTESRIGLMAPAYDWQTKKVMRCPNIPKLTSEETTDDKQNIRISVQ